ncbi:hypothetical protein EST38_g9731 [Candolleomyces aberdarensis]|uniref:Uncharacterized protein n=1 Tax=Candolleomyces aberdarensis TaxID=2316362 RepID=A0A4V1Q2S6_9AGAR|nr:hypothetical protein EST38_g9731 [Candolleomyces aberdarensis]
MPSDTIVNDPRPTAARSNFTDEEWALLQSYQERKIELLEQLRRLEDEILDVQGQYDELYNSKSDLMKLPNEILSEIFQGCAISRLQTFEKNRTIDGLAMGCIPFLRQELASEVSVG